MLGRLLAPARAVSSSNTSSSSAHSVMLSAARVWRPSVAPGVRSFLTGAAGGAGGGGWRSARSMAVAAASTVAADPAVAAALGVAAPNGAVNMATTMSPSAAAPAAPKPRKLPTRAMPKQWQSEAHVTVMKEQVVQQLRQASGRSYFVDATAGDGGHAAALLEGIPSCRVLCVDRDASAIERCKARLAAYGDRVQFHHGSFADLPAALAAVGFPSTVNGIVADLGFNTHQLHETSRGFSYQVDGPLDMRIDQSQPMSASTIINKWPADKIAEVLKRYGDEPQANMLAQAIVDWRGVGIRRRKIRTTLELRYVIDQALDGQFPTAEVPDKVAAWTDNGLKVLKKLLMSKPGHPETLRRVFSALRIAANEEQDHLKKFLSGVFGCLAPGGRFVTIAYHPTQDEPLADFMDALARDCVNRISGANTCLCGAEVQGRLVHSSPLRPDDAEIAANPRARSAHMRVVERLCSWRPAQEQAAAHSVTGTERNVSAGGSGRRRRTVSGAGATSRGFHTWSHVEAAGGRKKPISHEELLQKLQEEAVDSAKDKLTLMPTRRIKSLDEVEFVEDNHDWDHVVDEDPEKILHMLGITNEDIETHSPKFQALMAKLGMSESALDENLQKTMPRMQLESDSALHLIKLAQEMGTMDEKDVSEFHKQMKAEMESGEWQREFEEFQRKMDAGEKVEADAELEELQADFERFQKLMEGDPKDAAEALKMTQADIEKMIKMMEELSDMSDMDSDSEDDLSDDGFGPAPPVKKATPAPAGGPPYRTPAILPPRPIASGRSTAGAAATPTPSRSAPERPAARTPKPTPTPASASPSPASPSPSRRSSPASARRRSS